MDVRRSGVALLASAALAGCTDAAAPPDGPASPGPWDTIIPEETADEAALATMTSWQALPVLGDGQYRQQSSEDRHPGDPVPVALMQNGNRDMNHFVCAGAEAEVESSQLVPLRFDLDSCPESYVRGLVTTRFEGSGRLARIWLTALSFRELPPDEEWLRIYVDEQPVPLVQAPLAALLDGTAGEMFAPPFGAGTSWRMAWYYPVVFSSKLIVAVDRVGTAELFYHQADVVLDAQPTERRAAASRLPARDDALALLRSGTPATGEPHDASVSLPPGQPVTAHELAGPATVQAVLVTVSEARLEALADVRLAVRWDGAAELAMELPLLELFAAALGEPEQPSLALASELESGRVRLSLRLPMPFASRAEWTLTNQGSEVLDLDLAIELTEGVPAPAWGHLHVQRSETVAPATGRHPVASADGPGRLVGVCLMMQGHAMADAGAFAAPLNFLEGDERIVIDGAHVLAGTGTEDYLNGAFYFEDGPSANAFAQIWNVVTEDPGAPDHGQVSGCRWHVLGDAIDFDSSLELDLEIGPDEPSLLDRYRSVAFIYR